MNRTATIAAATAAAVAAVVIYASTSYVPEGSVAVVADAGKLRLLRPGLHVHWPFAPPAALYPTQLPAVKGDANVTLADGAAYKIGYEIGGVLDPNRALIFHRAAHGRGVEGLLREVAEGVIAKAASARTTMDLASGLMEEGAARRAGSLLGQAGLTDVTVKLQLRDPETLMNLARALAPANLAGVVHDAASVALSAEPRSWQAHTAMGVVLESEKDFRGAERQYLDALEIRPAALPPMAQIAALYTAAGELEKLDRLLVAALAEDPNSLQHYAWLAASQMSRGRLADARATIERALSLEPANIVLLNNLAGIHLKEGRFDEAIATLQTAVQASPQDPQSLYNLGVALAGAGRPREALKHLEAAEAAGRTDPPLLRAIGSAYRESGQAAKAREYEARAREAESPPPGPGP